MAPVQPASLEGTPITSDPLINAPARAAGRRLPGVLAVLTSAAPIPDVVDLTP